MFLGNKVQTRPKITSTKRVDTVNFMNENNRKVNKAMIS